jgi:hypothetical protein
VNHLAHVFGIALVVSFVHASTTSGQSPIECAPAGEIDVLRLLRQTSLDLRGRIPTIEEALDVHRADDPREALDREVESWLDDEEFFTELRRHHTNLLLSRIPGGFPFRTENLHLEVYGPFSSQRTFPARGSDILVAKGADRRRAYRGHPELGCIDQEQTEFDARGRPVPLRYLRTEDIPAHHLRGGSVCGNAGFGEGVCVLEGWVRVRPYWNPTAEVRVCAFDVQPKASRTDGRPCGAIDTDRNCGCGHDLRWCSSDHSVPAMREALSDEPAMLIEHVLREGRPYHEAFTTPQTRINGPIAHFHRYLSGVDEGVVDVHHRLGLIHYGGRMGEVPDIPFQDRSWHTIERDEVHSGVLTTPAFLLRFNTHRARANRVYTALFCDPFIAAAGGTATDEGEPSPNLRERSGCADCHQVLEPAAAVWGRWRIANTFGYLEDDLWSASTPRSVCRCGGPGEPVCRLNGPSTNNQDRFCNNYFVTGLNSHPATYAEYGALPLSLTYLTAEERGAVEVGPSTLLDDEGEQRRLGSCATRTLAQRLLGRPLDPSEAPWLESQVEAFEESGWNYLELVTRMVHDPKYRAIR